MKGSDTPVSGSRRTTPAMMKNDWKPGTTTALDATSFSFEVQVDDSRKNHANNHLEIRVQGCQRPARSKPQSPVVTRDNLPDENAPHVLTFRIPPATADDMHTVSAQSVTDARCS